MTTDQHSTRPAVDPAVDPGTATARPVSTSSGAGRAARWVIWLPGLAVALGAAVATAHGLYEVAHAARVPQVIAWLYPLITDGLALVAYAATARLTGSAARYAWAVVVLAAGLSGLAQAVFLASDSAVEASPVVRFGVGAWPAIAAAIVAHLLYLLAVDHPDAPRSAVQPGGAPMPVQPDAVPVQPMTTRLVQSVTTRPVQSTEPGPVHRPALNLPDVPSGAAAAAGPALPATPEHPGRRSGGAPAGERARAAAARHAHRHGQLPTVSELAADAEVSRGTAHTVLKALRAHPEPLRLITRPTPETGHNEDDPTIEEARQP